MRATLPLFALFLCAGCEIAGSSDLATSEISAEMLLFATGDGTATAEAILRTGGLGSATFVELSGEDALVATFDGATQELEAQDLVALYRYRTVFESDTAGATVHFDLQRATDLGAPESTATLPDAFVLDPVVDAATSTDSLALSWSPSGSTDAMSLRVEGPCILTYRSSLTDSGSASVDLSELELTDAEDTEGCTLEVRLARVRDGVPDPAWEEATIRAEQQRSEDVAFTP